jgi:hypothetical protein
MAATMVRSSMASVLANRASTDSRTEPANINPASTAWRRGTNANAVQ